MAEFSYEDYFNKRAREAGPAPTGYDGGPNVRTGKYADVAAASSEKVAALEAAIFNRKANQVSLVQRLGLDQDSVMGGAVNLAAASVAGVANTFSGDEQANALVATDIATGEKTSSIQRRVGDVGISLAKGAIAVPEMAVGLASMVSGGNAGKLLNDAGFRPEEAKAFLDTLYSHEQQAANADVRGAEGFWNTMSQMAENPSTVPHALLESLFPMLAGGVAARGLEVLGMGVKMATAAGEGTVMAGSAAEGIRNQTADKLLTPKQAFLAAMTAPMGAAAARVGMAAGTKVGLGDIDEAIVKGTLGKSGHGAIVRTAGSGTLEAGEEGLQSTGETVLQNAALDKELTAGVGNAAAIGMVTGAAMGAPMGLADPNYAKAQAQARKAVDKAALNAAIQSNDVTAFLDQEAETYNPEAAVSALLGHSQLATATPETKAENLKRATEIVSDLDSKLAADRLDHTVNAGYGADDIAAMQQGLEAKQAALANLDPADTTRAESLTKQIDTLTTTIAATDPKALELKSLQIARMGRDLAEARKTKDSMDSEASLTSAPTTDQVKAADVTPDQNDPVAMNMSRSAVTGVINLAMKNTPSLSHEEATQLADNQANSLTGDERKVLRAFSASRIAANELMTMGKVTAQIVTGGEGNLGITDYQNRMADAISLNKQTTAVSALDGIIKFAVDHNAKSKAVADAFTAFKVDTKPRQVRSDGKGGWSVQVDGKLTKKERDVEGALSIQADSVKLVPTIAQEAAAITLAVDAMKLAYKHAFISKAASTAPAAKTSAAPSSAASTASAATPVTDNAKAVEATAGTAKAVEEKTEEKKKEFVFKEKVAVDSASPSDATTPSPSKVRTDENSGSTLRPDVTSEPATPLAPVATKDLAETVEAASNAVDEIPAETAPETGALTFKQSPDGTAFKQRNLLASEFTQVANREGDATQRPLVVVQNFLSQSMETVMGFIQGESLSEAQRNVFRVFGGYAKEWRETIKTNLLKRDNSDFYYKDMLQFFIQDQSTDLEENVKTAMSYAAFSWIAENAFRSQYNTDEEINLILNRDESTHVSNKERALLSDVGTRQNVVINALGQRAVQALGLKAKKDAPKDLMPKLESAMGAHIMKLLMDKGVLARTYIPGEDIAALSGNTSSKDKAPQPFLNLARTKTGEMNTTAAAIVEASKNTQGVMDKLFGVEAGLKEPSFEPIPFIQTKTRNTSEGVPEKLAEIMQHENAQASYIREDMYRLASMLDTQVMLEISGVEDESTEINHAVNRSSVLAKNDGLKRELERFMGFASGMKDLTTALYFEHSVWKQQRVGIATNVINPQTSKIHRHMLFRKSWETKVDRNNTDQMENFRLRVAEGLGIKTDKQSNEKSLIALELTLQNSDIKAAVAVLVRSMDETLNSAEQQVLLTGVKAGGEKMHSLDALMALAHHDWAIAHEKTAFTVQMMGEVDGVTNGPMLSHLLMGAASNVKDLFALLNRGGFYEEGNSQSQYNLWRGTDGHLDLYETTALHMTQAVQTLLDTTPNLKPVMHAIYNFTGTLAEADGSVAKAGRNIIKTPLTAMVFGSSVGKAVDSMAEKFIESIYARIEDASKGKADKMAFLADLKMLGVYIPLTTSIEDLMELELTPAQVNTLKGAFKETLGKSVEQTMKHDFAPFIEQRRQFNLTAQMTFELYNAAYTGMRDQFIDELVQKGEIAVDGVGNPIHDLTAAQDAMLRKRLASLTPIMHTMMSKDSGKLSAGLRIAKSSRKLSPHKTYEGEIKFGTAFNNSTIKGTTTRGYEVVEAAPGVAMAPMSVHSTDSAISHYAAMLGEVLNVHDAHGAGLANFEQTARNLNQATWQAMLNYSPAAEMTAALSRTIQGLAELVQKGNVPPAMMENLAKVLQTLGAKQEIPAEQILATMMADTHAMAFQADDTKLQALGMMNSIDQYALQGGNYQVTENDRAEANTKRDALKHGTTSQERAAIDQINTLLSQHLLETVSEPEADPEMDVPSKKADTSVFGTLGKPVLDSDPAVVALFATTKVLPVKKLIGKLYGLLSEKKATNVRDFRLELLKQLIKSVPADLNVRIITATTPAELATQTNTDNARGWYSSKSDGTQEIQVLGTDFTGSALTTELLIHELLHGALARLIRQGQNDATVAPLIAELEALRTKSKVQADKDGTTTKYAAALENLDEFISWGMSNLDFQTNVLGKITMRSTTKKNTLVDGMTAFIKNITGILFRGTTKSYQAVAVNGMAVLISNVSGLLDQNSQLLKPVDVNLNQLNNATNDFTTQSLYDQLDAGQVDNVFNTHLKNLLGSIVEKLHGPFGSFKESFMANAAGSAMDVFSKAMTTGVAPFASKSLAAGILISSKEAYAMEQVEATVRAALNDDKASSHAAYRELSKLYLEARGMVAPKDFHDGDWALATVAEIQEAEDTYNFIFKMESNGDKTDHLSRFAALGLTHQKFNKLLGKATSVRTARFSDMDTMVKRIQFVFDSILDMFNYRVTQTFGGQNADIKLNSLVSQLVDIEAKRLVMVKQKLDNKADFQEKADDLLAAGIGKAKTGIEKLGRSAFFENNKSAVIGAVGSIASTIAGDRMDILIENIAKLRDQHFSGAPGLVAGLFNELREPREIFHKLLRTAKHLQKNAMHVNSQTSYFALNSFADGKSLSTQERASISAVFLRTGAHVLLDQFSMEQIAAMLSDRKTLDQAIYDEVAKLNKFAKYRHYYVAQAKILGYNLATGKTKGEIMLQNAGNIARLYETPYAGKISETQAVEAEKILDVLTTLYALSQSKSTHLANVASVMTKEIARTGGNGIKAVLSLHKKLEQQSRERLFAGSEALMMKGYLPEIYNPHIEVQAANNSIDGQALLYQGYSLGAEVIQDRADPDQQKRNLYVLKDGGKQPLTTGIMSYQGMSSKGGSQLGTSVAVTRSITAAKQAAILQMFQPNPNFNPAKVHGNFYSPILNAKGQVTEWRYLMEDSTKDNLLERNSSFETVLGAMAGSIYDKEVVTEQNRSMVQAMHDMYKAEFAEDGKSFIKISATTMDPEMREIYRMIPDSTKEEIKKIWGEDGMLVRKELLDISFGYHKLSLSSAFDMDRSHMNLKNPKDVASLAFVFAVEWLLTLHDMVGNKHARLKGLPDLHDLAHSRDRAAVVVRKYERIWQEMVKETKEIIVVKTGTVMMANISSNIMLLKMSGVSVGDIVRSHLIAIRGARDYQRDNNKLFQLEEQIKTGYIVGDTAEITREITRLKDALARNPVRELIDAGLMPTIVEDVDAVEDTYSYKTKLARKVEAVTAGMNPTIVKGARAVYMAKDTAMYKVFSETTQLSDFVARYTLYQHLTSRKIKPLTSEAAIQEASDAFINYDIPMHRLMQYSDDMGLTMFTKYVLRVQRIIVKMAREHPGSVISTMLMTNYVLDMPNVLSASPLSRFSNRWASSPVHAGAFEYPGMLDELFTVNTALSAFN